MSETEGERDNDNRAITSAVKSWLPAITASLGTKITCFSCAMVLSTASSC